MTRPEDIARLIVAAELRLARCGEALVRTERALAVLRAEADRMRDCRPDPELRLAMRGQAAQTLADVEVARDLRLRDLGLRLAELAATRDTQRTAARRALGRLEAIRLLAQEARRR